jgi:putative tricarboxylic transport membrane protein
MNEPTNRRPGELLFVVVLAIFSGLALWQSYSISGFEKLSSPGVFPMLAASAMVLSTLFIVRDTLRKRPGESTSGFVSTILPSRLVLIILAVLCYVVLMPWLGFLLDSGLFLVVTIAYLWNRPLWQSILVSGLALLSIHLIFRILFQVVLPQGSLLAGWH